jgi:hypothetical protein
VVKDKLQKDRPLYGNAQHIIVLFYMLEICLPAENKEFKCVAKNEACDSAGRALR